MGRILSFFSGISGISADGINPVRFFPGFPVFPGMRRILSSFLKLFSNTLGISGDGARLVSFFPPLDAIEVQSEKNEKKYQPELHGITETEARKSR